MLIKYIRITPLQFPLKKPYVWAQGVEESFIVNLIEFEAEDGTIGYGETMTAPDATAQKIVLTKLARSFLGKSVFDYAACESKAFRTNFLAFGGNMPRYANQMFSGLNMALMDLQGKVLGCTVWDLLGGACREDVGYFYFLQGETTEELVHDAKAAVLAGYPILYMKVGISEKYDLESIKSVRSVIGNKRLRLDANEAWDPAVALRMIQAFSPYNIEYLEQPTSSWSQGALKHLKERSPIALGADQTVFTIHDVYQACTDRIADMISIGPREVGGLRAMIKAAAIAEGAGLKICIHGSMTTGISTCAEHHVARAIPNLDDGNQIMWQLMRENIIAFPSLVPENGRLSLGDRPGLGFELNVDIVKLASERYNKHIAKRDL